MERRVMLSAGGTCGAASDANLAQPAGVFTDGGVILPPGPTGGEDNPVRTTINGTAGADVVIVSGSGDDITVTLNGVAQTVADSVDELVMDLGSGDDKMVADATISVRVFCTGSGGDDTLQGGGSADELSGANGKDRVLGGDGFDYLLGGANKDYLNGQNGNDTCSGAGGKDRIFGGNDADSLLGGDGNDYIFSDLDGAVDAISGGPGSDIASKVEESLDIVASIETTVP
jgi:Ca2+-binding RTX toxin-like protein